MQDEGQPWRQDNASSWQELRLRWHWRAGLPARKRPIRPGCATRTTLSACFTRAMCARSEQAPSKHPQLRNSGVILAISRLGLSIPFQHVRRLRLGGRRSSALLRRFVKPFQTYPYLPTSSPTAFGFTQFHAAITTTVVASTTSSSLRAAMSAALFTVRLPFSALPLLPTLVNSVLRTPGAPSPPCPSAG